MRVIMHCLFLLTNSAIFQFQKYVNIFFVEKHNGDGINMLLFGLEMGAGSSYFLPSQSQAQELIIGSYGES